MKLKPGSLRKKSECVIFSRSCKFRVASKKGVVYNLQIDLVGLTMAHALRSNSHIEISEAPECWDYKHMASSGLQVLTLILDTSPNVG